MLLLVDNYDSFTYNLYQYLRELGTEVRVERNDKFSLDDPKLETIDSVVISPGPGAPLQSGLSMDVIQKFAGHVPIFGVCLGHQCIAQTYGGAVVRADMVMHGKTSKIHHDGLGVFKNLPDPFEATRYHSLVVDEATLPKNIKVTAWTDDGVVMGLRHCTQAIEGVQFHPESILTVHGKALLSNFLSMTQVEKEDNA